VQAALAVQSGKHRRHFVSLIFSDGDGGSGRATGIQFNARFIKLITEFSVTEAFLIL
jgi:hypothetical protein